LTKMLCYITASEALERFRARDLSPVELLEAVIERANEAEPVVNAFCDTYYDEAREVARKAEAAYRRGEARALEGIPIAVKDEMMIAGKVTSNGSLWQKGYVAEKTDVQIQRLMDAGAVIHARTATPEFSMIPMTWSILNGVTRNPWSTRHTVGGSSGGSACSLASGTTTLATGSDMGGSIRSPAALNGVMGIKPPYGRMPEAPLWNRDAFAQGGPLARSVQDVIRMYNVTSGIHPSDQCSLPKIEIPHSFAPVERRRVAFSMDLGYYNVDQEIQQLMRTTLGKLESAGVIVEEVQLGWTPKIGVVTWNHFAFQAGALIRSEFPDSDPAKLTTYMRDFLDRLSDASMADEFEGWRYADEMYAELQDKVFSHCDVLLCPTIATNRIPADFDPSKDEIFTNGESVSRTGLMMTSGFNLLNRCPVFAMPMGRTSNGMPAGFQIVGPCYSDERVFRYASAFEQVLGPFFQGDDLPSFT